MTNNTLPLFKLCNVAGCAQALTAQGGHGLCRLHYGRWYKTGTTGQRPPRAPYGSRPCEVADCDRTMGPASGRGMCALHYGRWQRNGDPHLVIVREKRQRVVPCSVDGCEKTSLAKDLCGVHYEMQRKPARVITCQACGLTAEAIGKRTKTCSPACQVAYTKEANRRLAAENRVRNPKPKIPKHPATCAYCQQTFMATGCHWKYCSRTCCRADLPNANYSWVQLRRTLVHEGPWEEFERIEIFLRDAWTCGLCNKSIDPKLAWPNPWSASLDHIVPLSRGGFHTRANCQAAHLRCNISKGNRVPIN